MPKQNVAEDQSPLEALFEKAGTIDAIKLSHTINRLKESPEVLEARRVAQEILTELTRLGVLDHFPNLLDMAAHEFVNFVGLAHEISRLRCELKRLAILSKAQQNDTAESKETESTEEAHWLKIGNFTYRADFLEVKMGKKVYKLKKKMQRALVQALTERANNGMGGMPSVEIKKVVKSTQDDFKVSAIMRGVSWTSFIRNDNGLYSLKT